METEEILATIQMLADTIATPTWTDILSVVLSFFAIIVAGFVAWRQNKISKQQADISEQQNKIAVFDKRYEIYDTVSKCVSLSEYIFMLFEGRDISVDNIHLLFALAFKDSPIDFENLKVYKEVTTVCLRLKQAEFLFSENVSEHLMELSEKLLHFVLADAPANQSTPISVLRERYCQTVKNLETDRILQEMKENLHLATPK